MADDGARRRVDVLATAPDDTRWTVGPVYGTEAALKLALELKAAGWTADGVRPHLSRAEFRALAARPGRAAVNRA